LGEGHCTSRLAEAEAEALRVKERAREHAAAVRVARETGKLASTVVAGSGTAVKTAHHKRTKSDNVGMLAAGQATRLTHHRCYSRALGWFRSTIVRP
jgi:hypothetical protein